MLAFPICLSNGPPRAGTAPRDVLFEYEQKPPPPPIQPGHQVFRQLPVTAGGFSDWFAPHDAHVYRFKL